MLNLVESNLKRNWTIEAWNRKTKDKVEGKIVDIFVKNGVKHYKLDNGKTIDEKEWSINTMG